MQTEIRSNIRNTKYRSSWHGAVEVEPAHVPKRSPEEILALAKQLTLTAQQPAKAKHGHGDDAKQKASSSSAVKYGIITKNSKRSSSTNRNDNLPIERRGQLSAAQKQQKQATSAGDDVSSSSLSSSAIEETRYGIPIPHEKTQRRYIDNSEICARRLQDPSQDWCHLYWRPHGEEGAPRWQKSAQAGGRWEKIVPKLQHHEDEAKSEKAFLFVPEPILRAKVPNSKHLAARETIKTVTSVPPKQVQSFSSDGASIVPEEAQNLVMEQPAVELDSKTIVVENPQEGDAPVLLATTDFLQQELKEETGELVVDKDEGAGAVQVEPEEEVPAPDGIEASSTAVVESPPVHEDGQATLADKDEITSEGQLKLEMKGESVNEGGVIKRPDSVVVSERKGEEPVVVKLVEDQFDVDSDAAKNEVEFNLDYDEKWLDGMPSFDKPLRKSQLERIVEEDEIEETMEYDKVAAALDTLSQLACLVDGSSCCRSAKIRSDESPQERFRRWWKQQAQAHALIV